MFQESAPRWRRPKNAYALADDVEINEIIIGTEHVVYY
jgi:hypothetical protein